MNLWREPSLHLTRYFLLFSLLWCHRFWSCVDLVNTTKQIISSIPWRSLWIRRRCPLLVSWLWLRPQMDTFVFMRVLESLRKCNITILVFCSFTIFLFAITVVSFQYWLSNVFGSFVEINTKHSLWRRYVRLVKWPNVHHCLFWNWYDRLLRLWRELLSWCDLWLAQQRWLYSLFSIDSRICFVIHKLHLFLYSQSEAGWNRNKKKRSSISITIILIIMHWIIQKLI